MQVTDIIRQSKTRVRITTDRGDAFALPLREWEAYGIADGDEIPEPVWQELVSSQRSTVLKKCGSLLTGTDYTGKGLLDKLIRAGYLQEVAEEAVGRMEEAHYVDDSRYASQYIRAHAGDRSRLKIRLDLQGRGLSKDVIEEALRNYEEESGEDAHLQELENVHKLLAKRHFDPETATPEERQKTCAYLAGKGYGSEIIREAMH